MISIRFEQEAIDNLKSDLTLLKADKIFLVTGKKSYKTSGAQKIIETLKGDFEFIRFKDFENNPNIIDVEKGVSLFKENNCNCILAIGGGSSIDMAKLIKFFIPKKKPFTSKFKNSLGEKDDTPLVALPTTAGTGSEATHFAVVYVGVEKYSISDELLLPNHAAIISKLHFSQTPYQKAVSGLDAFSQAIESFWSINSTEESRKYSLHALKLIIPSLSKITNEKGRENIDLYRKMAKGAYLAGKAINIAKTTAAHAFSYYLTKRFNLPHGHAVAIFLPSFIEYNFYLNNNKINSISKYDELISLLDVLLPKSDINILNERVEKYILDLGVKINIKDLNISKEDIIIALKGGNIERLKNNPREFNFSDFIKETSIIC